MRKGHRLAREPEGPTHSELCHDQVIPMLGQDNLGLESTCECFIAQTIRAWKEAREVNPGGEENIESWQGILPADSIPKLNADFLSLIRIKPP